MISYGEALRLMREAVSPLGSETVALAVSCGRVLAADVRARVSHPGRDCSAMDGYALSASEFARGASFRVVGEASAASPYPARIGKGEVVRIHTGGALPAGADAVLLWENAVLSEGGARVRLARAAAPPRPGVWIRKAGLDFKRGEVCLGRGTLLDYRHLTLAAAMGHASLTVTRSPGVALIATGDELVPPGATGGLAASSLTGLAAFVSDRGGVVVSQNIVADDDDALRALLRQSARKAQLIVTTGGTSEGGHDGVARFAGHDKAFRRIFHKIAVKPGMPMLFGKLDGVPLLGLPGNPVSTLVGARIALEPLLFAMLGVAPRQPKDAGAGVDSLKGALRATLAVPLAAQGRRSAFMRARLEHGEGGVRGMAVRPLQGQDSAMLRALSEADALLFRPAGAPAAKEGGIVRLLTLPVKQGCCATLRN